MNVCDVMVIFAAVPSPNARHTTTTMTTSQYRIASYVGHNLFSHCQSANSFATALANCLSRTHTHTHTKLRLIATPTVPLIPNIPARQQFTLLCSLSAARGSTLYITQSRARSSRESLQMRIIFKCFDMRPDFPARASARVTTLPIHCAAARFHRARRNDDEKFLRYRDAHLNTRRRA